jgi:hypothetical protein
MPTTLEGRSTTVVIGTSSGIFEGLHWTINAKAPRAAKFAKVKGLKIFN